MYFSLELLIGEHIEANCYKCTIHPDNGLSPLACYSSSKSGSSRVEERLVNRNPRISGACKQNEAQLRLIICQ